MLAVRRRRTHIATIEEESMAGTTTIATYVSALILGLSAGAMLSAACVTIPSWRTTPAEEFLAWYALNYGSMVRFFGPLQISAIATSAIATALAYYTSHRGAAQLAIATVLAIVVLLAFPAYFRDANASFESGTIALADVPAELSRYERWQWSRTLVGIAASLFATIAIGRGGARGAV
jgi:hypothetical protein